jgi:prevent-host-death family protein
MSTVSVRDARASLPRLIDRALSGEKVVITRKGRPVVRLTPIEPAKAEPRRLEAAARHPRAAVRLKSYTPESLCWPNDLGRCA